MKKFVLTLLLVCFVFGLTGVFPVLFQEGNPVPIVKGIVELSFNDDKIVQISENPKRYITKTNDGKVPLIELMEKEGWIFNDQLGAVYIFSKEENRLIITSVQYTGRYRIWEFPH